MIGEIITGGLSLLGGLFGKKKQKQTTETTVDYVKMAQSAQAAGFNPLTALRNGGSAGFTSSTTSHPGLSGVGDAISQIGGTLGAAISQRLDPIAQKRDAVESALLDYQLKAIQSGPKRPMMFGDVPTKAGAAGVRQHVAPLGRNNVVAPPTNIVPGDNPVSSSTGLESRFGIYSDPGSADAETYEKRYGEPGDWVGGVYTVANDLRHSFMKYMERKYPENAKKYRVKKSDFVRKPTVGKEYGEEVQKNIRESVPSLARPPVTTW